MAAYGLYTHIASNKTRSMLLLAGLFLLIYVMVFAGALIGEVAVNSNGSVAYYINAATRDLIKALPFATIGAVLWIIIAYFGHQKMIDSITGSESVTRQEQPRLYNLLENLCISRGIPMPKLKIMDSPALNAFATGLNPKQYSVTVTTGLLAALSAGTPLDVVLELVVVADRTPRRRDNAVPRSASRGLRPARFPRRAASSSAATRSCSRSRAGAPPSASRQREARRKARASGARAGDRRGAWRGARGNRQ